MTFYKYHGAGNDFILFDDREGGHSFTTEQVAFMCHRHFGIGADGLMLLRQAPGYDFRMVYYNSDGREGTMCGNGGRCLVAFARSLGIIGERARFIAVDGEHSASIAPDGLISLHMKDVAGMNVHDGYTVMDTGSLHYVQWVADVQGIDVFHTGRAIRNQPEYKADGINVNFVQRTPGGLSVRTYERGVEEETLSCGTGVTAAAIAATGTGTGAFTTHIQAQGGDLQVTFTKPTPTSATNIMLIGPATFVFKGDILF